MRRAGGYAVVSEPGKPDHERDTFTCCHCNRIVPVPAGEQPKTRCAMCDKPVCDLLRCYERCEPFEKKLEAVERRYRFLRAVGAR